MAGQNNNGAERFGSRQSLWAAMAHGGCFLPNPVPPHAQKAVTRGASRHLGNVAFGENS
jgi:hypothetical protein